MILQGLVRVALGDAVRYRPYRTHRIRLLPSQLANVAKADALAARLIELVANRLQEGASVGFGSPEVSVPATEPDRAWPRTGGGIPRPCDQPGADRRLGFLGLAVEPGPATVAARNARCGNPAPPAHQLPGGRQALMKPHFGHRPPPSAARPSPVIQGPHAHPVVQPADILSRDGLESPADAATRQSSAAGVPRR
jgi:hypothetical protein